MGRVSLCRACAATTAVAVAALALASSCRPSPTPAARTQAADAHDHDAHEVAELGMSLGMSAAPDAARGAHADKPAPPPPTVDAGPPPPLDPMATHAETRDDLLSLFSIKPLTDDEKKRILPDQFLRGTFNTDGPHHMNQGNKAIASHKISKAECMKGLEGITLQTPEQRAKCGGAENMVPVWLKGKEPWFCIDVFEFPNKPCELPMVWTPPSQAKRVCELQGKRLCSDIEWNVACRGDPGGGADQRYAYGERVDLSVCNTKKGHIRQCIARDAKTAWQTCATETEPSGSFPKCRSRFGVFDQHGNVAEVMMRREGDKVVTQLKGSAWFYDELVKEPNEPTPASTPNKEGAYPDHCNFDPRWHVEPMESAFHVNYHLGFRCCKSIP